jgi:hypothetical protein
MMLGSDKTGVPPAASNRSTSRPSKSSNARRVSHTPRSERASKLAIESDRTEAGPTTMNVAQGTGNSNTNTQIVPLVDGTPRADGRNAHRLGHSQRESIASIKDDPFFRNYQTPQLLSLAQEERTAAHLPSTGEEHEVETAPTWINRRSNPASQAGASVCPAHPTAAGDQY